MRATWIALVAAIGCGGGQATGPAPAPTAVETDPPAATSGHAVDHGGIQFQLDPRIAAAAVVANVAACPLGSPTDKPDGVAPAHVAFRLGSATPAAPARTCSVPDTQTAGLYVFDAAEWAATLKGSDKDLDALRQLLAARAQAPGRPVPFVPFVDATFAIAERLTFVDFSGGSGVLFLGELSIEPDTLGRELVFVFQGLTADGKRYVLGLFPATTRLSIPAFSFDAKASYQANAARWEPYRADVARQIAAAADDQLTPSPAWLRPTLESLTIR